MNMNHSTSSIIELRREFGGESIFKIRYLRPFGYRRSYRLPLLFPLDGRMQL